MVTAEAQRKTRCIEFPLRPPRLCGDIHQLRTADVTGESFPARASADSFFTPAPGSARGTSAHRERASPSTSSRGRPETLRTRARCQARQTYDAASDLR